MAEAKMLNQTGAGNAGAKTRRGRPAKYQEFWRMLSEGNKRANSGDEKWKTTISDFLENYNCNSRTNSTDDGDAINSAVYIRSATPDSPVLRAATCEVKNLKRSTNTTAENETHTTAKAAANENCTGNKQSRAIAPVPTDARKRIRGDINSELKPKRATAKNKTLPSSHISLTILNADLKIENDSLTSANASTTADRQRTRELTNRTKSETKATIFSSPFLNTINYIRHSSTLPNPTRSDWTDSEPVNCASRDRTPTSAAEAAAGILRAKGDCVAHIIGNAVDMPPTSTPPFTKATESVNLTVNVIHEPNSRNCSASKPSVRIAASSELRATIVNSTATSIFTFKSPRSLTFVRQNKRIVKLGDYTDYSVRERLIDSPVGKEKLSKQISLIDADCQSKGIKPKRFASNLVKKKQSNFHFFKDQIRSQFVSKSRLVKSYNTKLLKLKYKSVDSFKLKTNSTSNKKQKSKAEKVGKQIMSKINFEENITDSQPLDLSLPKCYIGRNVKHSQNSANLKEDFYRYNEPLDLTVSIH